MSDFEQRTQELNTDSRECTDSLMEGTVLFDRYRILRTLGQGGFGITYLGFDSKLEREVAIKEYFPSGMVLRRKIDGSPDTYVECLGTQYEDFFLRGRQRALDEAKRVARFTNIPGIVTVYDHFEANGTAYIVMEYVHGETLETYIRTHKTKVSDMLGMIHPIFLALDELHRNGIIHRDISPDNIMYSEEAGTKLLDFGASGYCNRTNDGMVILKHGYAPIEQYHNDGNQGPWTDVYALAATIYKLISGHVPQVATDRIREDRLEDISKYTHKLSWTERIAIMKALSVNPVNRWDNIREFEAALYNGVLPESNGSNNSTDENLTPEAVQKRKKIKFIIIPLVALVNIALIVLCLFMLGVVDFSKHTEPEEILETTDIPETTEAVVQSKPEESAPEIPVEKDVALIDLTDFENNQNAYLFEECEDTVYNTYTNELVFRNYNDSNDEIISYDTKGKYTHLLANLSCFSEIKTDENITFGIYLDDSLDPVYSKSMGHVTGVETLDIPVNGAQKVTFRLSNNYSMGVILSGARFYADEEKATQYYENLLSAGSFSDVELYSLPMIDSVGAKVMEECSSTLGYEFKNGVVIGGQIAEENYAVFYLGGHYKRFVGNISCNDDNNISQDFVFDVVADDELDSRYVANIDRMMATATFDIDVTGVEFITIKTYGTNYTGALVTDARLYTDDAEADAYLVRLNDNKTSETIDLDSAKMIESAGTETVMKSKNSLGNEYLKSIVISSSYDDDSYALFYLGKQYTNFVANISCLDSEISNKEFDFSITDDKDNVLYSQTVSRTSPVMNINVNVENTDFMKMTVSGTGSKGIIVSDGRLFVDSEEATEYSFNIDEHVTLETCSLHEFHIVDSHNVKNDLNITDNNGNERNHAVVITPDSPVFGTAIYYLDGQYDSFVANIAGINGLYEDSSITFAIYSNNSDTPLYRGDFTAASPVRTVNLDVSGAGFLYLRVYGSTDMSIAVCDGRIYTDASEADSYYGKIYENRADAPDMNSSGNSDETEEN